MKPDAPWVLHDLRRTVASGMARLGIRLPVIEKVLNHVSGTFRGIVGAYQRHDFAAEKRDALAALGRSRRFPCERQAGRQGRVAAVAAMKRDPSKLSVHPISGSPAPRLVSPWEL